MPGKFPLLSEAEQDELRDAVWRGADRMDQLAPDWARTTNVSLLDMRYGSQCVAGQQWGGWAEGLEGLHLREEQAPLYGFAVHGDFGDSLVAEMHYDARRQAWDALKHYWLAEIAHRLS